MMKTLTRRDFLKLAGIGAAGTAAALALASCGKKDEGTTGGAATGGTTGTTGGTTSAGGAAVGDRADTEGVSEGGSGAADSSRTSSITVLLSMAPDTHPWFETWRSTATFPYFVAQHLADVDYETGELHGVVAKELIWNEDKTAVDIKLYDNITDSDGNPFTANDLHWMYHDIFAADAAYEKQRLHRGKLLQQDPCGAAQTGRHFCLCPHPD